MPVEISVQHEAAGFSVIAAANETGPSWKAATTTAATIATLLATRDPRSVAIEVIPGGIIDGPSGGTALSVGILAALEEVSLQEGVAVTGSMWPNGALGPVSGIPEKLRAAADAGYHTVILPEGQQYAADSTSGIPVDIGALAHELGTRVIFVDSIAAARDIMVTGATEIPRSDPGPLPPDLADLLLRGARAHNTHLTATPVMPSPGTALDAEYDRVRNSRAVALEDHARLMATDPVIAFARASFVLLAVSAWNARVTAIHTGDVQGLMDRAATVRAEVDASVTAVASASPQWLEQVAVLPSVVAWGVQALLLLEDVEARLSGPSLPTEDLGALAADIERASSSVRTMETLASAASLAGRVPIHDATETYGLLSAVGAMMAEASTSNIAAIAASPDSDLLRQGRPSLRLAQRAQGWWGDVGPLLSVASDPSDIMRAVSVAWISYVLTASLMTERWAVEGSASPTEWAEISDPEVFRRQVDVAVNITALQAARIAAIPADPSYLRIASTLAAAVATAPRRVGANDDILVEGLHMLWQSNLAGQALLTLLANQQSPAQVD